MSLIRALGRLVGGVYFPHMRVETFHSQTSKPPHLPPPHLTLAPPPSTTANTNQFGSEFPRPMPHPPHINSSPPPLDRRRLQPGHLHRQTSLSPLPPLLQPSVACAASSNQNLPEVQPPELVGEDAKYMYDIASIPRICDE